MAEEDPFAEVMADLAPSAAAREKSETAASVASVGTPVAMVALVTSVVLAALSLLGFLPTGLVTSFAVLGYLLTPVVVMIALVTTQNRVRRAQLAGASLGADVERRLRRIHFLAVLSLLAAVRHVWVLAQVAGLWWYGR